MKSQSVASNPHIASPDNSGHVSQVHKINLKEKIEPILQKITDEKKKKAVEEFWYTHFAEYIGVLASTDFLIEKGEVTPEDVYEDIHKSSNNIVNEGDKLEGFISDKKIMMEIKDTFRDVCGHWVYKSKIMKHAYEKPFGYAGDFKIIELIYDNNFQSFEIYSIGYCFDKYFLTHNYSKAARARKEKIKELLFDSLSKYPSNAEVLNIGCGSSREIKELLTNMRYDSIKKISFSLLDSDINALFFSDENLKDSPSNIKFQYINNSIVNLIRNPMKYYYNYIGKDIIYSLGLFDYLSNIMLKQLVFFLYSLLNPGGIIIIAHPDSKTYKPIAADWFCDWRLNIRNKMEFIEIINQSGINNFSLKITEESVTKIIFFIIIEKNK